MCKWFLLMEKLNWHDSANHPLMCILARNSLVTFTTTTFFKKDKNLSVELSNPNHEHDYIFSHFSDSWYLQAGSNVTHVLHQLLLIFTYKYINCHISKSYSSIFYSRVHSRFFTQLIKQQRAKYDKAQWHCNYSGTILYVGHYSY